MCYFEKLLCENQLAVERFVKFRIPNILDAEDILQEVFFTAFKNFEQLKNEASFKGWLIAIARHKCNDYFRKKSKDFAIPIEELNESQLVQTRFGYVENHIVSDVLEDWRIKTNKFCICPIGRSCLKRKLPKGWAFLLERLRAGCTPQNKISKETICSTQMLERWMLL